MDLTAEHTESAEVFRFFSATSAFSAVNNGLVTSLRQTAGTTVNRYVRTAARIRSGETGPLPDSRPATPAPACSVAASTASLADEQAKPADGVTVSKTGVPIQHGWFHGEKGPPSLMAAKHWSSDKS